MPVYVDIAFSLVSVFLMLSLLVTAINEVLATLLKQRGRLLFKVLNNVLGGNAVAKFSLARVFATTKTEENNGTGPTLFDAFIGNPLMTCDSVNIHQNLSRAPGNEISNNTVEHASVAGNTAPSYMCGRVFARTLLQALIDLDKPQQDPPGLVSLPKIRKSLERIEQPQLRALLTNAVARSQNRLEDVEQDLEQWFDNLMDRVSGIYKRRQMLISFFVAFVIAICLNLDVIKMASEIKNDEDLLPRLELINAGLIEIAEREQDSS